MDIESLIAAANQQRVVIAEQAEHHAGLRLRAAAAMIREMCPTATMISAWIQPDVVSTETVRDSAGTDIPETEWVDDISLAEDQLASALDFCLPENAGWERCDGIDDDGNRLYRLELPPVQPPVPSDFPVKVLGPNDPATDRYTCGECGRSWDDAVATVWTPTPAGRCPFEYYH